MKIDSRARYKQAGRRKAAGLSVVLTVVSAGVYLLVPEEWRSLIWYVLSQIGE